MAVNPLMPTLKLPGNVLLYSNTAIGTLAVDGWAVTFGTASRALGGLGPRPVVLALDLEGVHDVKLHHPSSSVATSNQ